MGYALKIEKIMREMICGECGVDFAAPELIMKKREEDGKEWYCPNGHCRVYSESKVQKLEKQLTAERQRADMEAASRRTAEMEQRKTQEAMKRLTKRVSAGVCPCCNRTFQNLARHMQTKHKDEAKSVVTRKEA